MVVADAGGTGGWAHVRVESARGAVTVTVVNTGPRVEPHECETMFEPFRQLAGRVASGSSGSGLGLPLVLPRPLSG